MMTCSLKRKTIEDENNSDWDEIDLSNKDENKIILSQKLQKKLLNILILINKQSNPDNFDEVLDDMKNEHNDQLNLKKRIENNNERDITKASIKAIQLVYIDSTSYKA
ncbi:hypothetical protein C1645_832318 [Glomus cerebriforme]|uniref:Uncharacterized protein n=1 Tax=Glomus cerebriforme TaxID=658196 RepID=A0A397SEI8_9GLOM|nr:hypothetical protein C1645_832318 [Glomus cerebriforme]